MLFQTYDDSKRQENAIATMAHDYLDTSPIGSQGISHSSGFLKSTAIAALVSLPTIIQPVFASQPDTMILPEGISRQPTFLNIHNQPKETTASIMASTLEGYVIHNTDPVESYLTTNSDLLDFLALVSSKLKEVESIESIELEYYHDSEENWDKLFVVAKTQLENMDELDQLEATLFGTLFEPEVSLLSGRVVLSIG